MGLDLYAKVEPYLGFEESVKYLHSEFLRHIFEKNLDNILDVGCGQGAFMIHLEANGKTVSGIDLSAEQIKVCQSYGLNAQAKALEDVKSQFDCVTAIFDVINYIPPLQLKTFFQQTYDVLNEGGFYIFDVNSLFGFEEIAQGSLNINLSDRYIGIDAVYEESELQTQIAYFTQNHQGNYQREDDTITQYFHDTQTLQRLLEQVGFCVDEVSSFNLHCDEEADKLIFMCKK
jgi:cyclopropane fatty-acyl-phospholipid synthase-like methyltransferase